MVVVPKGEKHIKTAILANPLPTNRVNAKHKYLSVVMSRGSYKDYWVRWYFQDQCLIALGPFDSETAQETWLDQVVLPALHIIKHTLEN